MVNNKQEEIPPANHSAKSPPGLIDQWGGKLALFFTTVHFSYDLSAGILVALIAFIRQDLNLTYLQSSFLVSAYALTSGLSQLLGGWASDRMSKNKAITLGLVGVGITTIAIGFAPSYYAMIAFLITKGIFAGFYHPAAVPTLTTHFPEEQRGRVVSLHMMGGSLGFALSPLLGALIAGALSWRFAFLFLSLPSLFMAPFVLTRLKIPVTVNTQQQEATSVNKKKSISVWQVFRPALGIIAISVAMQLLTGPIMSFISLFLIDVHGLSVANGSMWVTIIRMSGLAGGFVSGWLCDRWGRRNTIFLFWVSSVPLCFFITKLSFGVGLA
jgi:FSR family fosmidomycin resistance protein-like MFS transporter